MARKRIQTTASAIRPGDGIVKTGKTDHANKALNVTEVTVGPLGGVRVDGTTKTSKGQIVPIFRGLASNLKVTVLR